MTCLSKIVSQLIKMEAKYFMSQSETATGWITSFEAAVALVSGAKVSSLPLQVKTCDIFIIAMAIGVSEHLLTILVDLATAVHDHMFDFLLGIASIHQELTSSCL